MTLYVLIIGALLLLGYTYWGYPRLVALLARAFGKPWQHHKNGSPMISVIVAAYNEELVIRECLDSLLSLEYPTENLEILVGSDGSSDRTDEVLQEYAARYPRIKPHLFTERRGKIPVVNDLVAGCCGDILFFTDADVVLDPSTLGYHVQHYVDDTVGGVAGNLILAGKEGSEGGPLHSEQLYMSIENRLRADEARLQSTVGIFGGHYSIRRSLWRELPDAPICDELLIALRVISSRYRVIFEHRASAFERFGRTIGEEYHRKVRFASRGLSTMTLASDLLGFKGGWIALMLWSHKILRWTTPFVLILVLTLTLLGLVQHTDHVFFQVFAIVETLGLLVVLLVAGLPPLRSTRLGMHLLWFISMNVAFGVGTLKFLTRREQRFWTQPRRVSASTQPTPEVSRP